MPQPAPTQIMQGIEVPASSVNPQQFFAQTRRLNILEKNLGSFAGLGSTDTIPILQTGVLSGLTIQLTGQVVVTLSGGTVATTARWPYDLIRAARFTANGQSNLINCHGWKLKLREIMARGDYSDRGVPHAIGGASPGTTVYQGSIAGNNEVWGLGQNVTAIVGAPTTYPFVLEWYVPIAFDDLTLTGAIFAQTSATDLYLAIDWAPQSDLFYTTGTPTIAVTGALNVFAKLYTIPQAPNGNIIVPDLSTFHSLIESRYTTIGLGDNEVRLAGQGVGKQLLRLYGQVWNGTASVSNLAPLPINATNFGNIQWKFGGQDIPESWNNGVAHAFRTEQLFDSDISTYAGCWCFDFCNENAFRDSVDEATATELRFLLNIASGVTLLGTPAIEYVQETASLGSAA
jgi:hypothetical protein